MSAIVRANKNLVFYISIFMVHVAARKKKNYCTMKGIPTILMIYYELTFKCKQ